MPFPILAQRHAPSYPWSGKEVNPPVPILRVSLEGKLVEHRDHILRKEPAAVFKFKGLQDLLSLSISFGPPRRKQECINRNSNRLVLSVLNWEFQMNTWAPLFKNTYLFVSFTPEAPKSTRTAPAQEYLLFTSHIQDDFESLHVILRGRLIKLKWKLF